MLIIFVSFSFVTAQEHDAKHQNAASGSVMPQIRGEYSTPRGHSDRFTNCMGISQISLLKFYTNLWTCCSYAEALTWNLVHRLRRRTPTTWCASFFRFYASEPQRRCAQSSIVQTLGRKNLPKLCSSLWCPERVCSFLFCREKGWHLWCSASYQRLCAFETFVVVVNSRATDTTETLL